MSQKINNLMKTIKKIGLNYLQDLAYFFANLEVVDLKINTAEGERPLVITIPQDPQKSVKSHNTNMRD